MRLLLIEPDKTLCAYLKRSLIAASFSIDTADTGPSGSYLARTNDYDLIISEFNLPDRSGIDICKELRTKEKHTPFIIISSLSETITKVQCLNSGSDDFITKPFYFEELLARIRAVLRRPKITAQSVLTIADLELDSLRHVVKRGAKQIYLTRKEFELLEYFLRNQTIVLSRGHIMEHVWDIHADIFSNTIETHILNLRRKIDFIPGQKLIHTIPGRGYKLEANLQMQPLKQKIHLAADKQKVKIISGTTKLRRAQRQTVQAQ